MRKAALFISSLHKGGAERVMSQIAHHLLAGGYEVVLVTQRVDGDEYALDGRIRRRISDLMPEETAGSSIAGRIVNLARRFRKLREIWKEEKPDVILSFIGKNNVMAILTAKGLHIPVVCGVRGDPALEYEDPSLKKAAFRTFGGAARIVLQTERSRNFFPENISKKAIILPNPIEPQFLMPPFEGERDGRIVTVGRIDANKNQRLLIDAFCNVADRIPDCRLEIFGQGPDLEQLRALVKERGMEEWISLPGPVDRVQDRIRSASLFVLPSDTEGMPNALLEAMSLGLPCISTDCPSGGPAQLIKDGVNGLLVPVRDEKRLGEAMVQMLTDRQKAEEMGRKARGVQEIYAPDKALQAWEQCLAEAADIWKGK